MKKQSADQFKLVWNPRKQLMLVGMQHYYDAEIKNILLIETETKFIFKRTNLLHRKRLIHQMFKVK